MDMNTPQTGSDTPQTGSNTIQTGSNTPQTGSDYDRKVNQAANSTKDSLQTASEKTKDAVQNAADKTSDAMDKAVDKTSDALKKAGDKIKDVFGSKHDDNDNRKDTYADTGTDSKYNEEAFIQEWKTSYWTSGGKYEDYQPSFQYGAELAENELKHLNRSWEEVEPSAHAAWELYNRDSEMSWEKNKDAIKFGWDTVMQRAKH